MYPFIFFDRTFFVKRILISLFVRKQIFTGINIRKLLTTRVFYVYIYVYACAIDIFAFLIYAYVDDQMFN